MTRNVLFNKRSMSDLLYDYERQLPREITKMEGQQLLTTSFSDMCAYFEDRFRLVVPTLLLDRVESLPPQDIQVPLSPHESDFFYDGDVSYVPGTLFSLHVPYEGDPDLFQLRPRSGYMTLIEGTVVSEEDALLLTHPHRDHDTQAVKAEFDQRLKDIQEYLETQRQEVAPWNERLPDRVRSLLEDRKKKALAAQNISESLGFPLRRRDGSAYAVPVERKRIAIEMPKATASTYAPEPQLEMQAYEDILEVISSLSVVMERSPSAFATMSEEHLRDHILAILNTQLQGRATGETFNRSGKTDILVREKDRHIFIAECKFWNGPKALLGAIDQILAYACWRDTKVAVIVFNRRKDFSAVVETIPETVARHPQCKRRQDYRIETGCRFIFGQKGDPNRELVLTVLAFDVPSATETD